MHAFNRIICSTACDIVVRYITNAGSHLSITPDLLLAFRHFDSIDVDMTGEVKTDLPQTLQHYFIYRSCLNMPIDTCKTHHISDANGLLI